MLTKDQILKAMVLTPSEIDQAIRNNNYGVPSPTLEVEFKGLNQDVQFVYEIKFKDLDGTMTDALAFISYFEDNTLVAEF